MTIELVAFASLKSMMGLEDSLITDYPALSIIRDGVTAAIEGELGRALEKVARTHTLYPGSIPTQMISLPGIPVASVASVTLTYSGEDEVLSASDYEIVDYGIRLWSKVRNCKVTVVYTGGLLAADVPPAMASAALLQTVYEFQNKEHIGAESVSTEGGMVSRPPLQLLPEVRRRLAPFKHPLKVS